MGMQLNWQDRTNQHVSAIYEIRDKVKVLNKCQRKMQLSALDPDNMRILMAAYEHLSADISKLCWRIGL